MARIWIFAGFTPANMAPTTRSGTDPGKEQATRETGEPDLVSGAGEQDVKGEDYDFSGTLALEQVTDLIPADAHYYFCGPVPFMKAVKAQLENVGVPAERMHYEVFGPIRGL